ncbi:MAG: hypothetical protein K2Q06_12355 [Parvularculaceae bacterium]|nr:hypothetical protein [Parvularculaceae bacterium]
MKSICLAALAAVLVAEPAPAFAAKEVAVVGVPADTPKIGKTRCVAPFVCEKKGEPGVYAYSYGVIGRPGFLPGSVTLMDGAVVKGDIALLQFQADWEFVKHVALIIPKGEAAAVFVGPGAAFLLTQTTKGEDVYDAYGDVYLRRLVSGPLRLSYNPAAGTSKKVADFLPPGLLESGAREVGGREIMAALKDGRSLKDLRKGGSASQALVDVVSSIEITEKEYLIYDEAKQTTTLVTKANYGKVMGELFSACPAADKKQANAFARAYGKIVEAFQYLNATCFK